MPTSARLTFRAVGSRAPDPGAMERLRREIDMRVAPIELQGPAPANAKGGPIDVATFAVGALSTPATVALIGVLKAHFERQRGTEIELEGPGGKFRLKADDARKLDLSAWTSTIGQAMGRC